MTIIDDDDVAAIRSEPESQMMKSIKGEGAYDNLKFWMTKQKEFR